MINDEKRAHKSGWDGALIYKICQKTEHLVMVDTIFIIIYKNIPLKLIINAV